MKTNKLFWLAIMKRTCILIPGLGLLLNLDACRPKEPVEPDIPKLACYLKSYNYSSRTQHILSYGSPTSYVYEETRATLFAYNADRTVASRTEQWNNSREPLSITTKTTYTYENGYLIASEAVQSGRSGSVTWNNTTTKSQYSYENGLLTKGTFTRKRSDGLEFKSMMTFEYNSRKQLTRLNNWGGGVWYLGTEPADQPPNVVYLFENGNLIEARKTHIGSINTDTYTLINPGYYQKYTYGSSSDATSLFYEYDLKGRRTRVDVYSGAQRTSYATQTFDIAGKEAIEALPQLKGWPNAPALRSMAYLFGGYSDSVMPVWDPYGQQDDREPATDASYYFRNGNWVKTLAGIGTYALNTQGFPEGYNYTGDYNDGHTRASTSKTTTRIVFDYENCQ